MSDEMGRAFAHALGHKDVVGFKGPSSLRR